MHSLEKQHILLLSIAVLAIAGVYFPGITGALYYDDYSNLKDLGGLTDLASLIKFVFGGEAGPLGRPIALLSFVPLGAGWPDNSSYMLVVNLCIHVGNFIILYFIGNLLLRNVTNFNASKCSYISLIAALMWALLPLLASTSLIAIQRMTGLSTLFGLLGLYGFVKAYSFHKDSPVKQAVFQLSFLGLGTLFAMYTKESGALFPVYALIIDIFIVGAFNDLNKIQKTKRLLLWAPLVFILGYLSPLNINWVEISDLRGFSALERLGTQAVILWEYLFKAFIPQEPRSYGPFHDYYGIKPFNYEVILAVVCWGAVVGVAVIFAKKMRWFSFSIFWFLTGHLIESTTILLELYFEHRNYLALYGICLALTVGAWSFKGRLKKIIPLVQMVYIVLIATILFSITSLWGDQRKAAESWSAKHPGSARAALHSVFQEISLDKQSLYEGNQRFLEKERYFIALKVLDRTKNVCPDCLNVRLQALLYSCAISDVSDRRGRFDEIYGMAGSAALSAGVIDMLFNLSEFLEKKVCLPIEFSDMRRLIGKLEQNPKLHYPEYGGKIYFIDAMAAQQLGDNKAVYSSLAKAEKLSPNALPVLQYQVYYSLEQGDLAAAKEAIARRENLGFRNDDRNLDLAELARLKVVIEKYEQGLSQ